MTTVTIPKQLFNDRHESASMSGGNPRPTSDHEPGHEPTEPTTLFSFTEESASGTMAGGNNNDKLLQLRNLCTIFYYTFQGLLLAYQDRGIDDREIRSGETPEEKPLTKHPNDQNTPPDLGIDDRERRDTVRERHSSMRSGETPEEKSLTKHPNDQNTTTDVGLSSKEDVQMSTKVNKRLIFRICVVALLIIVCLVLSIQGESTKNQHLKHDIHHLRKDVRESKNEQHEILTGMLKHVGKQMDIILNIQEESTKIPSLKEDVLVLQEDVHELKIQQNDQKTKIGDVAKDVLKLSEQQKLQQNDQQAKISDVAKDVLKLIKQQKLQIDENNKNKASIDENWSQTRYILIFNTLICSILFVVFKLKD